MSRVTNALIAAKQESFSSPESIVFQISRKKNGKNYICIVEGKSDEKFYHCLKDYLYLKKSSYIPVVMFDNLAKKANCKEKMKSIYNKIKNIPSLGLDKLIIIVDHDYTGIGFDNNTNYRDCFSVTNNHSFENYFFKNNNIDKIFEKYEIESTEFKCILSKFINENEYYYHLRILEEFLNCDSNIYKKENLIPPYKGDDIFKFSFKCVSGKLSLLYNKELRDISIERMEKIISYDVHNKIYDIDIEKIKDLTLVRGHDIFNLLSSYLIYKFNINIKEEENSDFEMISRILDVDMEFKNILGEKIN